MSSMSIGALFLFGFGGLRKLSADCVPEDKPVDSNFQVVLAANFASSCSDPWPQLVLFYAFFIVELIVEMGAVLLGFVVWY